MAGGNKTTKPVHVTNPFTSDAPKVVTHFGEHGQIVQCFPITAQLTRTVNSTSNPSYRCSKKGGSGATRTTNPRVWLFLFDEEPETCKREMKLQLIGNGKQLMPINVLDFPPAVNFQFSTCYVLCTHLLSKPFDGHAAMFNLPRTMCTLSLSSALSCLICDLSAFHCSVRVSVAVDYIPVA